MSDENKKRFGKKIASIRISKNLDQQDLAEMIGTTPTTISRWENGLNVPKQKHLIIGLKRVLGLTEDDFLEAFGHGSSLPPKSKDRYTACSFSTAAERLGSYKTVDDVRLEIMGEWPAPEEPGEYGTDEKWLELLELSPETGGVLFHDNDEIVGYWQCLPVLEDTYNAILRGENVNKVIGPNDLAFLTAPDTYKMYFVDLFIRKKHDRFSAHKAITLDFLTFMREAAEVGMFFDKIAANITGTRILHLCMGLGFRRVIEHQVHRYYSGKMTKDGQKVQLPAEIYELVIGPDAERLFSHDSELADLYAAQGLFLPETQ